MRIDSLSLTRLRHDEFAQFNRDVSALAQGKGFADNELAPVYQRYTTAQAGLNRVLDQATSSVLTEPLNQMDLRRDQRFSGLVSIISGCLYHYEPDKQRAAEQLQSILRGYGNVAKLARQQETAALSNLIDALRKAGEPSLQVLDLVGWVDALEADNRAYEEMARERVILEAKQAGPDVPEERKLVETVYQQLVVAVEGMLAIKPGEPSYEGFANELNTLIARYKTLINERYGQLHRGEGGGTGRTRATQQRTAAADASGDSQQASCPPQIVILPPDKEWLD